MRRDCHLTTDVSTKGSRSLVFDVLGIGDTKYVVIIGTIVARFGVAVLAVSKVMV